MIIEGKGSDIRIRTFSVYSFLSMNSIMIFVGIVMDFFIYELADASFGLGSKVRYQLTHNHCNTTLDLQDQQ